EVSPGGRLLARPQGDAVELRAVDDLLDDAWADLGPALARARAAGFDVQLAPGRVALRPAGVFTGEVLAQRVPALPVVTSVNFSGRAGMAGEQLRPLKGLPKLEELNLSQCRGFEKGALEALRDLKALRRLNLSNCDTLTDADLAPLAGLEA